MIKGALLPRLMLSVCWALSACSEIGFTTKDKVEDPDTGAPVELNPDLRVNPRAVDLGALCASGEATVTLENVGEGELSLTRVQVEGGWSARTFAPPVLAPGASFVLELATDGGAGQLVVESNDPDEPSVGVPLESRPNTPPTLELLSPAEGAVLPGSDDVLLEARVSDADGPPTDLRVAWSSDVDGPVPGGAVQADGLAFALWPSPRTPGHHQVRAEVTDACGQSASQVATVCQQAAYDEEDYDIASWDFAGSASWDASNGWLELTPALTDQVGSAFSNEIAVSGADVEITFLFFIGDGTGADGISLTALDQTRATSRLGGTGCGIGYGGDAPCTAGPALPGWSLEVDTYYNGGQDPTAQDHLMFTFDGDVDDPAVWVEIPEVEDTGWHTLRVVVRAPRVTVELDGVPYIDQEVSGGTFDFPALVGFTAGTGGETNRHLIDALVVTELVCPEG
jgi:hypothetical protein